MLPAATPPICLRCHLRETLLHLRLRRQPRPPARQIGPALRSFSHQRRQSQELASSPSPVKRRPKDYFYKHVGQHGEGRIIGKPGKRQRATSQKLTTKALDERVSPSQIVIFQDVKDEPRAPKQRPVAEDETASQSKRKPLTIREIEDEVVGRNQIPDEAEVNASIDELRPAETVVSEATYTKLRKSLVKAYTRTQLHQYLLARAAERLVPSGTGRRRRNAVRQRKETIGKGLSGLTVSAWQPLKKPSRRGAVNRPITDPEDSRMAAVDQVLRLAWDITVQSEVHSEGRIQIEMGQWQRMLLFSTQGGDGKPYFESIIKPGFLLETCRVQQQASPKAVVAITGRRQVAEEVSRQLTLAIMGFAWGELDLMPFLSTTQRSGLATIVLNSEYGYPLRTIRGLTKCVVFRGNELRLSIKAHNPECVRSARRTLLSLLKIPSYRSFDSTVEVPTTTAERRDSSPKKSLRASTDNLLLADMVNSGLHTEYREQRLARNTSPLLSVPQRSITDSIDHTAANGIDTRLAEMIKRVPEPAHGMKMWKAVKDSYWDHDVRLSDWEAEFCRLLEKPSVKKSKKQAKQPPIPSQITPGTLQPGESSVQRVVPGCEALLSYLKPRDLPRPLNPQMGEETVFDRRQPYLIAHFVPIAPTPEPPTPLPRIKMRFRLSTPTSTMDPRQLMLIDIRAQIDEQHLNVRLPAESTDVRFMRNASVIADTSLALKDTPIKEFCAKLTDSVQRGEGALDAPSELIFRLPAFFLDRSAKVEMQAKSKEETKAKADGEKVRERKPGLHALPEVNVRYLLERFEQVQSIGFKPSKREPALEALPPGSFLEYREIDSDAVYGSSTSLSLHLPEHTPDAQQTPSKASSEEPLTELVKAAISEAVSENAQPEGSSREGSNTAGEESQLTRKDGESEEQTTADTTSDAHAVERRADSSQDSSANTLQTFAASALRIARLLTKGRDGSLRKFGER